MSRKPLAALLALPLAAALAACDVPAPDARASSPAAEVAESSRASGAEGERLTGRFVVAYGGVQDPTFAGWQEDFRKGRFLEDLADWLNGWIALPDDITLTFAECGEPNAFYEPEDRTVALCFELVDELDHAFEQDDQPEQSVNDALLFTTLHEVGHALVNVLQLPITGREEDAVDQLAAIILVDGSADGDVAAINGVRGLPLDEDQLDELTFADEHALNGQRFYNVLCLVYGQNPGAYAGWVDDGTLPPERAERCPQEYDQTQTAWNLLLKPYLRA